MAEFLTDAHAAAYERDGFTVVRGGFSPRTCELVLDRIERGILGEMGDLRALRAASKPFVTYDQSARTSDEWFLTSGDAVRPFFEEEGEEPSVNKVGHALHELDPVLRALAHCGKITGALRRLGYEAPVPVQSMYIAKSAKVGGEVSAHQDSTFLVSQPYSVCGIWIALRKATVENGCMFFVRGSHRTQPVDRLFLRDPNDENRTMFEPPNPPPYDVKGAVAVEADVGDVVIFHGSVVHFSAPNRSNIPRPAYVMHFSEQKCGWHPRNWLRSRFFQPLYGAPFTAPVLDLSKPGPDLERQWDLAMMQYGFAIVTGHGVSDPIIERLKNEMKAFFAKPDSYKRRFSAGGYGHSGYNPLATEAVADVNRAPDHIESFYIKPDQVPHEELRSLLSAADAYKRSLDSKVLLPLLRLSARALGLDDERTLERLHANHNQSLKLSHYPPQTDQEQQGSQDNTSRYGAHTDWEGFTLLLPDEFDDEENGLEVMLKSGAWVSTGRIIPNAIVVNAGDFFPVWTSGRWHSPVHRVRAKNMARSRYSIPYFTGPNLKLEIRPLVENVSEETPKFVPVVAGDWLEAKRARARI